MSLAIRVEIAPGANPAASPDTFVWENAGRVRTEADIQITAGRDDEATATEPGSLTVELDDRDGDLSPRNVLGKWYGKLSNGTPLRLLLDRASDDMTRSATVTGGFGATASGLTWLTKSSGGYLSNDGTRGVIANPDSNTAAVEVLDGAGSPDVEIAWSTTFPVAPTGGVYRTGAVVRYLDNSNYVRIFVEALTDGTLGVFGQRTYKGSSGQIIGHLTTGRPYVAGQPIHAKVRADGSHVMVKTWTGSITADEPAAWDGVGIDLDLDATGVGLMQWKQNTNAGTFIAYVDNVTITNILWQGAVPEWPVRWPDKSGADAIAPIAAAGVLRRLAQGASPLVSPLRRQLLGQNPVGYYPLEDGSGSTSAASGLSRRPPAAVNDVSFAGNSTLNGSATSATLNTAGVSTISATMMGTATPDGYAALFFFKLETLPAGEVPIMEIRATGTITRWVINLNVTAFGYKGYDRNGSLVVDNTASYGGDFTPLKWGAFQLETNVSGGLVTVSLIIHQVGTTNFGASSFSYSGTAVSISSFTMTAATDNMSAAHLWFGDNDLPFVDGTFVKVADGYFGETARDRLIRLCAENGVPFWALSGSSEPMGRQRVMKLVELLRECEAADQGILYERGLGLAYIPRQRRYNVPVTAALSWPGLFDEPPEPQDDDQRLRNEWTVSRVDGSSATVRDEDSVDQDGLYDDSVELNISSDLRLPDYAGWFVGLGTTKSLRWPRFSINFMKHPELIGPWLACRIGSRITIADPPSQIAGEVIDVVIEGNNQWLNLHRWVAEIAAAPARPWQVGTYDDATLRYDVDSALEIDLDPDDTWAPVITANRFGFWSHLHCPYEILAAGQHNMVLGMSRPDSIALADGTFVAGQPVADGWYAVSGSTVTVTTSTDRSFGTGFSAQATVAGSPSQLIMRNSLYRPAATAGQTFEASAWIKRSTAGNVTLTIDYLNGSAAWFASSAATVAVAADTWTYVTVTGTAPAGTAMLEYGPTLGGSPANGVILKAHNIDILRTDVRNRRQLATLQRATDGFVKALPSGSSFRIASSPRYGL